MADPIFRYLMRVNCEGEIAYALFRSHNVDISAFEQNGYFGGKTDIYHVARSDSLPSSDVRQVKTPA